MEFNYEIEYHKNLRNRIETLTPEQLTSIKLIIEFHKPPNTMYNKNGLFVRMSDLSNETIRDMEYLINLFEQANKFVKTFKSDPFFALERDA